MELKMEQRVAREPRSALQKPIQKESNGVRPLKPRSLQSQLLHDHLYSPFKPLDKEFPASDPPEKKLRWLRSQIIGFDSELESPFGRRRLTYADHTATGRSLQYIENFILRDVLPFYGNTHTGDSYVGHRTSEMVREATSYIKQCLGGGEDDALLFSGSGSTAAIKRLQEVMGIAVPSILRERMLKSLREVERWVVFVGPHEHHSNLLSWRQSLAEVVEIGLDGNGLLDLEALKQQLESFKTANRLILGSFSACSNVTGTYSDTRAIARLLHQYGGFACFDFAANGPYAEIDMRSGEEDGYDAIFLSVHKFLGGPGSPGILLMSKNLYVLNSSPPSTCGGGVVTYVKGLAEKETVYVDDIEERENAGTPMIIQIIRAALAFWTKEYVSYPVIQKEEHSNLEKSLQRLLPNKNILILGNTSAKRQALLSFLVYSTTNSSLDCREDVKKKETQRELFMWEELGRIRGKPLHGPFVASLLSDLFGIQTRGGCSCAGPYGHSLLDVDDAQSAAYRSIIKKGYLGAKPGWTRVSFPYYMSNEEIEFILAALEFVAAFGQRFLPLYHFSWETGSWTLEKKALSKMGSIGTNHKGNENAVEVNLINKYQWYLEVAKSVASRLPKFPPERNIPHVIDPNLLQFRV